MDPLAQRLKNERERQGLSIRDLSVVTKIREPYIDALEKGRYDVLPSVYIRSFVRTLAQSMAIPLKEVNTLMDEVFDLDEGLQPPERLPRFAPPEPEKPALFAETMQTAGKMASEGAQKAGEMVAASFSRVKDISPPSLFLDQRRTMFVVMSIVAALVLATFLWWIVGSGDDEQTTMQNSTAIAVPGDDEDLLAAEADSFSLSVEVADTSWLTVTMDGERTRQLVLLPGSEHEWFASEKFVLSVSNAGGVRFLRNQEPLPLFGQAGESVREIVITRTDVRSTSAPLDPNAAPTAAPQQQVQAQRPAQRRTQSNRPRPRASRRTNAQRENIPLITPAPSRAPVERPR